MLTPTRLVIVAVLLLLGCVPASAQTPPPVATASSFLVWDQPNASIAESQSLTYTVYLDGAALGIVLTGVTCTGITPTCEAPFPAVTPGNHSLTITAKNAAGESPKSAPAYTFKMEVVPSAPTNVRKR